MPYLSTRPRLRNTVGVELGIIGRGEAVLEDRVPAGKLGLDLPRPVADADVEIVGRLGLRIGPRDCRPGRRSCCRDCPCSAPAGPANSCAKMLMCGADVEDRRRRSAGLACSAARDSAGPEARPRAAAADVDRRVVRQIGREPRRVACRSNRRSRRRSTSRNFGEVALEERRADAGVDGQTAVEEVAAIFADNLVEDGDREAVALLQDDAIGVGDRIVDREDVERLAIVLEEAGFAGLAVMAAIERVGDADRLVRADIVAQRSAITPKRCGLRSGSARARGPCRAGRRRR